MNKKPKISYFILIAGKPYVSVSALEAVAVLVADIRSSMGPEAPISVLRDEATDITDDFRVERSGDPDSVE